MEPELSIAMQTLLLLSSQDGIALILGPSLNSEGNKEGLELGIELGSWDSTAVGPSLVSEGRDDGFTLGSGDGC
jgi:hypothetical protein